MKALIRHGLAISTLMGVATFVMPSDAQLVITCALGGNSSYDLRYDTAPTQTALQIKDRIVRLLCRMPCGTINVARNITVTNAITVPVSRGISRIVYSPNFLNAINQEIGEDAAFGVLAHEIGHHVDLSTNFFAPMSSSWSKELRADAWSGCALARAGLSMSGMRNAITAISLYPSASHPDWTLRLPALQYGYSHCGGKNLPTPQQTHCGCSNDLQSCLSSIQSKDSCIHEWVERCVEACVFQQNKPEGLCISAVCTRVYANMRIWEPDCNQRIQQSRAECQNDFNSCMAECRN